MPRSLSLAGLFAVFVLVAVAGVVALSSTFSAGADTPPPTPGGTNSPTRLELAPIEGGDLRVAESFPPQYMLAIKYGLPSGCAKPAHYDLDRQGNAIGVKVWITLPTDPNTACTMIYGIAEHNIALGSDFRSGETYDISVNGKPFKSFVAQ